MSEDLHIDNDLPIPAAKGWQEMNLLLNREMPVRKFNWRKLIASVLPVLIFSASLLICSKKLDTGFYTTDFKNQPLYADPINLSVVNGLSPSLTKSFSENDTVKFATDISTNHTQQKMFAATLSKKVVTKKLTVAGNSKVDIKIDSPAIPSFDRIIATPEKYLLLKEPIPVKFINTTLPLSSITKKKSFKKWNLFAGAGTNIATTGDQNLQPYPALSLKYNITQKLFVSTGLSLFSPAPGTVKGVGKTIYINDSANNFKQYNEEYTYSKFKYLDVPLSIGLQLGKNISIQSGVQASLLLSKKSKKELVLYDYQMTRVDFATPPFTVAAFPEKTYQVNVPSMDYRFTGGINYKFNKTSVELLYQQSLKPSAGKVNNKLVSLHLYYQLK